MNRSPQQPGITTEPRAAEIQRTVRRLQTRLRFYRFLLLVPAAVSLALGAASLLAVIGRFRGGLGFVVVLEAAVLFILAAVLVVSGYAALRPGDLMLTARLVDRSLSLDERLSTALEAASKAPSNPLHEQTALQDAQLNDALASARGIDPRRDLPLHMSNRASLPPLALIALLFLLLFVPLPGAGPSPGQTAVTAQVQNERKEIEILRKALPRQTTLASNPAIAATQKELDDLLRDLGKEGISRDEALSRLSESQSKLEQGLDPQSPAKREALDALARQLEQSGSAEAREAANALKLSDPTKAGDALKKIGEQAASQSPEQRKALADELRKARDNAASLDPELANRLDEAAKALESNDQQASKDALNNLGQSVTQRGEELATQQQIEQALAQLQQSKENLAQAMQPTPAGVAGAVSTASGGSGNSTPGSASNGTAGASTPFVGSPVAGTVVAASQAPPAAVSESPASGVGTPGGTPAAFGSPVAAQTAQTAQTGTPAAQAGGTPQNGQGTRSGQAGSGSQPGSGSGSQNGQSSQGTGQGTNSGQPGLPGGGAGSGHTDPVYAPGPGVSAPSTAVAVKGRDNPGGEGSSTTTNTDANNISPAQVPYDQVYGQYRESAGQALNSDYIPQGYKDLVKDYFSSIAPENPKP